MLHGGLLPRREDDEDHEGEDAVADGEPPRDLAAARAAAHVGRGGRDEVNEEEDVDPAEGRVEGHVREGRDDRADDTADEGDDGEHEDADPRAALDGTAAAIGIVVPMLNSPYTGLRCEGSLASPPFPPLGRVLVA